MDDRPTFNASTCPGIIKGTIVIFSDDEIVYAGPIKGAPDVSGKNLVMNAEDFELLKTHVDKRRH